MKRDPLTGLRVASGSTGFPVNLLTWLRDGDHIASGVARLIVARTRNAASSAGMPVIDWPREGKHGRKIGPARDGGFLCGHNADYFDFA